MYVAQYQILKRTTSVELLGKQIYPNAHSFAGNLNNGLVGSFIHSQETRDTNYSIVANDANLRGRTVLRYGQ
jgi:hypothetical protein